MENSTNFRRFGTMIDCSRNAVMKINTLKRWIDITSDLGYNAVLLYTEDTYEVDDNLYFGHGRGRYSKAELRDIDAYAISRGVEIIPCIQTLAHLDAIVDLPVYSDMVDCDDILLVGDERVYALIDNMFKSLSDSLTTRHINIGMDEAHMIGRGKYYDLHGDCDRTKLLVEHIRRVAEIGRKYGFTLSMWSDMFFRLATNGDYYSKDISVPDEVKALIPDNVELVYWDYYSHDPAHYDGMLSAHSKIKEGTWFAGGLWTWSGFAPDNEFSIKATKAALSECIKHGVKDVFFTLWGDDTAECSKFSVLPSLFYASEIAKGNRSMKSIKEKFKEKYGIAFDRFMLLDLNSRGRLVNPNKYIFYNDLFGGRMDSVIREETGAEFAALARKLALLKDNAEWGYLFNTLSSLCKVISLKADLGLRIRAAYNDKDVETLREIIKDCKRLSRLVRNFYNAFEAQWMTENKGQGFDVQDIRIGGMMIRIEHCTKRLQDYCDGKLDRIEELEEELLDYFGRGKDFVKEDAHLNSFKKAFTNNVLTW